MFAIITRTTKHSHLILTIIARSTYNNYPMFKIVVGQDVHPILKSFPGRTVQPGH